MGSEPKRSVGKADLNAPYSSATAWGRKMLTFLDRLATSDVPVLILGETGVGKEVLARTIHEQSARANAPFLKLNCAALPSELIESELFGYERGSFTGAYKSSPGKFEIANGGTILLDEIGDIDVRLQAKLLQVLQDSRFLRIGGRHEIAVNARIIAATHRDLPKAIECGAFRQDLYYRLNVVSIKVPPLRERVDEIIPLATRFLHTYTAIDEIVPEISPALERALVLHDWPGNIRQLENAIRKYIVMRDLELFLEDLRNSRAAAQSGDEHTPHVSISPLIGAQNFIGAQHSYPLMGSVAVPDVYQAKDCSDDASAGADTDRQPHSSLNGPVTNVLSKVDEQFRRAEAEMIISVLNSTLWNRKQAADLLNVDYKALLYKMKKLGLSRRAHA